MRSGFWLSRLVIPQKVQESTSAHDALKMEEKPVPTQNETFSEPIYNATSIKTITAAVLKTGLRPQTKLWWGKKNEHGNIHTSFLFLLFFCLCWERINRLLNSSRKCFGRVKATSAVVCEKLRKTVKKKSKPYEIWISFDPNAGAGPSWRFVLSGINENWM